MSTEQEAHNITEFKTQNQLLLTQLKETFTKPSIKNIAKKLLPSSSMSSIINMIKCHTSIIACIEFIEFIAREG